MKSENMKICIYGAGVFGTKLYYQLSDLSIPTYCFSDKDPSKWGYFMDGVYCLPVHELLKSQKQMQIIVALKNPEHVVNDLQTKGFENVTDLYAYLESIKINQNVVTSDAFLEYRNIHFDKPAIMAIIEKFNEITYEMHQCFMTFEGSDQNEES